MLTLLLIPAMAFLNRFRGGGFGADKLPGHPRFYVAPAVALLAFVASGDPLRGLIVGACWLAWCMLPWGYLMCLGRWEPTGHEITETERFCLEVANGNWIAALALRHALGLLPLIFLVSPWALLLPVPIALAYEAAWRWAKPGHEIETGEIATGALWGALLAWVLA